MYISQHMYIHNLSFPPEEMLASKLPLWLPLENPLETLIRLCRCAVRSEYLMDVCVYLYILLATRSFISKKRTKRLSLRLLIFRKIVCQRWCKNALHRQLRDPAFLPRKQDLRLGCSCTRRHLNQARLFNVLP